MFVHGIFRPLVWALETAGLAERVLGAMSARRDRQLAKKNPLRSYVPGKQDVFVMTYAKSGTNWMMQIAHQLIHHGQGEFDHIHDLVPWPDTQIMGPLMRRYAIPLEDPPLDHVTRAEKGDQDAFQLGAAALLGRGALHRGDPGSQGHLRLQLLASSGTRVYGNAMPSIRTWFNLFLSDKFLIGGSWAVNTAGYWAQRYRPNVLVVSFKSMKRDLRATVLEVARFLDIQVSDDVIDEVCRRSSFEYMKRIDRKFRIGKLIAWSPAGAMIRKGAQGGSSELLSSAQQREADAYFVSELSRLGSDFPYEEFCDVARSRAVVSP